MCKFVNITTGECRRGSMNIEDDVKVEGGICNRVRIQYGTGIGYGYCLVRLGIIQGTEVRNIRNWFPKQRAFAHYCITCE